MSMSAKNVTQGGQITAYRWRMYIQVNNWLFFWISVIFAALVLVSTVVISPTEVLRNGMWYWFAELNNSFLALSENADTKYYDILYFSPDKGTTYTLKMSLAQMLKDPYMVWVGEKLLTNIQYCAMVAGAIAIGIFVYATWWVGRIGKKEGEDEFLSGMQLTDDTDKVNRMLKANHEASDLRIANQRLVLNAEVMNFLIHGTIGVGKSTAIRFLLKCIRKSGDRAVIYDSGGTFIQSHYDPKKDIILNPHDERCANWDLWGECEDVVDFENMANALIPVEGESDPFWVSSSRTIFSDSAMKMASDPDRSIEKFLMVLLSLSMKSLREFLVNTPSANLVEEKIEKTAISIRSVVTNYAKSLRYLQGLDKRGEDPFSIKQWMLDEKYDSSWLFISTTARHRPSVRPLISTWLSLCTMYLQSMSEDSNRRVWFILDELPSLQKIPDLNSVLAEARKFGGCFVIGIQNMPQLISIYGKEIAKAIFDLLNTRLYGRSPSADVAQMIERELGNQRRKEAREQNSYGLDQIRDGISLGKDKVKEPIVDYDQIMTLPNLRFFLRLPGEYPVVKLALKYKPYPIRNTALVERNIRDALSPDLEHIIQTNERAARGLGLDFSPSPILENEPVAQPVSSDEPSTGDARQSNPHKNDVAVGRPSPETLSQGVTTSAEERQSAVMKDKTVVTAPVVPVPPQTTPVEVVTSPVSKTDVITEPVRRVVQRVTPGTQSPVVVPSSSSAVEDRLAKIQARMKHRTSNQGDETAEDENTDASGEGLSLDVVVMQDDEKGLVVRSAGIPTDMQKEDVQREMADIPTTNELMADEERNILRHRTDYEAYASMEQDAPGGFER